MQGQVDTLKLLENTQRFGTHDNAFGFIRLVFASLVIVSHTVAMVDGNKGREPLYLLTGTTTFAHLAVDGFLLSVDF